MESKDSLKFIILIALCLISISLCCEEERVIVCERKNMTCLKNLCNCHCNHCRGLPFKIYLDTYVACSNVTEVPKEIPNGAEEIVITGNNITTIRKGAFNNMVDLYKLTLNDNKISIIEHGSFVNLPTELRIDLDNNKLSRITTNMFRDISLVILYLNGNLITEIEKDAFVRLPHLQVIYLDNNFLSRIKANMFSHTTIYAIFLKGNSIKVIERQAFVNLPNLEFIHLDRNQITLIEKDAFVNLPSLIAMYLKDNKIRIIEPKSFVDLGASSGFEFHLENNNLSRITAKMFKDIALRDLFVQENPITVIERHAFVNLPLLHLVIGIRPLLKKIETEAFVNLSTTALSIEMVLAGNNGTVIEKNAFVNVNFNYLVLGQNSDLKENRLITISDFINFSGQRILCDCDLMWFVFFRHDKPFEIQHTKGGGKCPKNNKTVSELVPRDFDDCNEHLPLVKSCNVSQSVDLQCEFNYLTTKMTRWIHSRNGKFIRELHNDFIENDTYILHFPFCNHDDSGLYTCILATDYSLLPSINRYTQLSVNGPPLIVNQHTEEHGDDLILSVLFYSIPYDFKIQWLLGNNSLRNGDPQYTIAVNNMTVGLKQHNVDVTTEGFISNLTIHNFKRRPSDVYSCRISNAYGHIVEQIVLGSAILDLDRRTYCDTSYSIELNCTLPLVGATPISWIHSNAGQTIRSLEGKHINNSNILTLPFCNSQDTGDFTCRWKTDILGKKLMEKSTTLSVSGPPFVISHFTTGDGSDTVFSVTFFSKPFPMDPKWYYKNELVALGTKFLQTTTYSIVQIRQHRVLVNVEGFVSNLTVQKAEYGLYKCVILNSFGQVNQLFVIEQEQNKSIIITEATTSPDSTENSVTVIIAICSSVVGVVIVVIGIIIYIRRMSPKMSDRYNSSMPTRDEDSTYDTISMSNPSKRPDDQADYMEVF